MDSSGSGDIDRPSAARERLGILGGMFNPPTVGHLALARAAASSLGLRRVLLTPVLIPPHKPAKWDPGAEHRLRMCRLAIDDDPRLGVCTLELERPGPSYTIDTLRSIHASDPDAELILIVGADMASTLAAWREPREILKLARLAMAERDDTSRHDVLSALAQIDGEMRAEFVDMPRLNVSSSLVRKRLTAGEPIDGLVGAEVAAYIAEHELYGRQPVGHAGGAR
ncbi:MAG TPA: nicotinate (nicotinamide) nucleotide adenylyltransferase [Solirubrobacteraceae bacterium]|nr:nicotinate (nicotinamide) nucleotide adenylyltransferase [Solirubrobacteraceae bacterium]